MSSPYTTQGFPTTPPGGGGALRAATTVLVAEDDADVRLLMLTLLRTKGYKTAEARDGQETLEVARVVRPGVVLVDLQLPRLNGFAVTRFLRQTETFSRVPIIVVSAHDPAKHRTLALAAGCNAYVQKPIDFDSLDGMIVNLLRRQ